MSFTCAIAIGVEGYHFTLPTPCSRNPTLGISITVTFNINGHFLAAAKSDAIGDTLDYDALCHHIKSALVNTDCANKEKLFSTVKQSIINFSPLITSGYLKIGVDCHETFTDVQHLL